MTIFAMLFVVSILGALFGVKKPWLGWIAGLLVAPVLFLSGIQLDIITLIGCTLFFVLLSAAYGYMSFIIFSGLKGGGHNVGQTYVSGFGAHHPGGIILSEEGLKILKEKNIRHSVILSY